MDAENVAAARVAGDPDLQVAVTAMIATLSVIELPWIPDAGLSRTD